MKEEIRMGNTNPRRFLDPEGKHEVPMDSPEWKNAPFEERYIFTS